MVRPNHLRACIALSLGLLSASRAQADWQFTKWGDSLESVLSYSGQEIRRTTPKEMADTSIGPIGQALATGPYRTNALHTQATYLFSGGGLAGLRLAFESPDDGLKALETLKAHYGKSSTAIDQYVRECKDIRYEWADSEKINLVRFTFYQCASGPFYSSILYTPLLCRKDTGL